MSIYGIEARNPAKPLTMQRIIIQTKMSKMLRLKNPILVDLLTALQTYYDFGFVLISFPSQENLSPFLTCQVNPLFKVLQSHLQEAFTWHTRLTWALQFLSNHDISSNILLVLAVSGHTPLAICMDLSQHLHHVCKSTQDLIQHNLQFMVL